jgi:hypothetical protein
MEMKKRLLPGRFYHRIQFKLASCEEQQVRMLLCRETVSSTWTHRGYAVLKHRLKKSNCQSDFRWLVRRYLQWTSARLVGVCRLGSEAAEETVVQLPP